MALWPFIFSPSHQQGGKDFHVRTNDITRAKVESFFPYIANWAANAIEDLLREKKDNITEKNLTDGVWFGGVSNGAGVIALISSQEYLFDKPCKEVKADGTAGRDLFSFIAYVLTEDDLKIYPRNKDVFRDLIRDLGALNQNQPMEDVYAIPLEGQSIPTGIPQMSGNQYNLLPMDGKTEDIVWANVFAATDIYAIIGGRYESSSESFLYRKPRLPKANVCIVGLREPRHFDFPDESNKKPEVYTYEPVSPVNSIGIPTIVRHEDNKIRNNTENIANPVSIRVPAGIKKIGSRWPDDLSVVDWKEFSRYYFNIDSKNDEQRTIVHTLELYHGTVIWDHIDKIQLLEDAWSSTPEIVRKKMAYLFVHSPFMGIKMRKFPKKTRFSSYNQKNFYHFWNQLHNGDFFLTDQDDYLNDNTLRTALVLYLMLITEREISVEADNFYKSLLQTWDILKIEYQERIFKCIEKIYHR